MNSHMVIEARDVTLRLGSGDAAVDVLRGLTLDVPAGQRIGRHSADASGFMGGGCVQQGLGFGIDRHEPHHRRPAWPAEGAG